AHTAATTGDQSDLAVQTHREVLRASRPGQPRVRCAAVEVIANDAAKAFITERGGRAWVCIDPHAGVGLISYVYLVGAVEPPGATRATKRMRSAKLPH